LLARKGGTKAAALDAGRGEFYFGRYAGGERMEALLSAEEMQDYADEPIAVCEETLARLWPAALLVPAPDASDALSAAIPRLLARDYNDVVTLDGNYVRRTDAQLFARPGSGLK
jgi:tRNA threonylcarbamoyladenosine biosynthesis protein TsaB